MERLEYKEPGDEDEDGQPEEPVLRRSASLVGAELERLKILQIEKETDQLLWTMARLERRNPTPFCLTEEKVEHAIADKLQYYRKMNLPIAGLRGRLRGDFRLWRPVLAALAHDLQQGYGIRCFVFREWEQRDRPRVLYISFFEMSQRSLCHESDDRYALAQWDF